MPRKKILNSERVMVRLKKPTVCVCKKKASVKTMPLSSYMRTVIEAHCLASLKGRYGNSI